MGLCCYTKYLYYGAGVLAVYLGIKIFKHVKRQRMLARWKKTPKDVVILHCFPPARTLPNASPFVLKVQTYLRMANIQFKLDHVDYFGPKGKTPWISLNGEHIPDSHFILQHLNKKFEKNFNGNYSEEQLSIARLVRITLEEYIFWGGVLYRMIFGLSTFTQVMNIPVPLWVIQLVIGRRWKKYSYAQGIGRHTKEEIYETTTDALRSVSKILGNKKFILGDEPCEDDCAIFGMLAQCIWGLPHSPYEQLSNGELKNIKEYCLRMKERFWADWDLCLDKK